MDVEFNEGNFDRRFGPTKGGLTGWIMRQTGASEKSANIFLVIVSLAVLALAVIIFVSSL